MSARSAFVLMSLAAALAAGPAFAQSCPSPDICPNCCVASGVCCSSTNYCNNAQGPSAPCCDPNLPPLNGVMCDVGPGCCDSDKPTCKTVCGIRGCRHPNEDTTNCTTDAGECTPCPPKEPPCDCEAESLDPVNFSDGKSTHHAVDADLKGVLGGLTLKRRWSQSLDAFGDDLPFVSAMHRPFGMPTSFSGEWTHNWTALLHTDDKLWSVRARDGRLLRFQACGPAPCWAKTTAGNVSIPDRLQRANTNSYVLWEGSGERLVFEAGYATLPGDVRRYFLTKVLNQAGATVADVTYQQPGSCPAGAAGTASGVPYIREVRGPDVGLRFSYAPTGNAWDCGLSQVDAIDVATNTVKATVAMYTYGTYTPFLCFTDSCKLTYLMQAATASKSEVYSYPFPGSSTFSRSIGSTVIQVHTNDFLGNVGSGTSPGEDFSITCGAPRLMSDLSV